MHQLQINFYYYYWNQQNQSINNWLIIIFHIFWKWFWYIERIGLSFPTFFNIHTVKLFIFYHSFILLSLLLPLSDLFRVSSLNVNQHWLNHWFFFFFQSDASTISPITIVDVDFFLNTNNNLCMILFVFIIIIYNWLIVYLIIKLKEWERITSHFLFDCLWPTTFGYKIETKFIEIK